MPHYPYLIVGGGMTADAAVRGIRDVDQSAPIGLISAEPHPPYNRPPLSKALWKGKPLERIWRKTGALGVTLHLGRTARQLDPRAKSLVDDQGSVYTFGKLLLATGATPRRLSADCGQIIYYRTLDDYQRLRTLTEQGRRFVVIGGGFIGSELAAALALNGKEVLLVFPTAGLCGRMFPSGLAQFLNEYYRQKGVEVLAETNVAGLEMRQESMKPVLKILGPQAAGAREIEADGVVAGIGTLPNVDLAQAAGLAVDNGIRVDASLRTSSQDIYAAGDVACFHSPVLDQWRRVEHEDNANTMGRAAGLAMAGKAGSYNHLPFFYSDLFDLGYEAVGEIDSRLETIADWTEPNRKGVIYYLRGGRVRGVLLWNVWKQVPAARSLIAAAGPFQAADLKGRIQ